MPLGDARATALACRGDGPGQAIAPQYADTGDACLVGNDRDNDGDRDRDNDGDGDGDGDGDTAHARSAPPGHTGRPAARHAAPSERAHAGRREPGGRDSGRRAHRDAENEALLRCLFLEHGAAMLRYATRLTHDRRIAEDVVQEALLRAWRSADTLTGPMSSLREWLLTVIRNIVIDRARARHARPTEVAERPGTLPVEHDHGDRVINSIVLFDALASLTAEHREVIVQIYLHGCTVRETAELLGIPSGTVKSRSYYALRALRNHLPTHTMAADGATG